MPAFNFKVAPFASETIAVDGTVKTLSASVYNALAEVIAQPNPNQASLLPKKARAAMVVVDNANPVRATEDLTVPVAATTGTVYNSNDAKLLESYEAIAKFKFTKEGGTNSSIQVTYYR